MTMQPEAVPLTRAGYSELERELDYLRTTRRREVAEEIAQSKESETDRDEDSIPAINAALESQGFVEGRIAEIENMLARARIIDVDAAQAADTVQLGSKVVLRYGGREHNYMIVGSAESNPAAGRISHESPIGAAVLGHRAGDVVEANVPAGRQKIEIVRLG